MVVQNNEASLLIHSETAAAAEVTRILGIEPTDSHEIGDTMGSGPRRAGSSAPTHWRHSAWIFTCAIDEELDGMDASGTTSLRQLLTVFAGRGPALASLRDRYTTRISWAGFSDSGQGGFVIESDLYAPLAELGCDFFGTVYASDE